MYPEHDEGWFDWKCPKCGESNTDSILMTAVPICGACDREFDWDGILSDEQKAQADALYEGNRGVS